MCLAATKPVCQQPTLVVVVALLNTLVPVPQQTSQQQQQQQPKQKQKQAQQQQQKQQQPVVAFSKTLLRVPTLMATLNISSLHASHCILTWCIENKQVRCPLLLLCCPPCACTVATAAIVSKTFASSHSRTHTH